MPVMPKLVGINHVAIEVGGIDEALERAGYDHASAAELAERPDVDLHRATALLESGCPVELAVQILR